MFFFFVGGMDQQVRRVVQSGVARCFNCGSRADLVEYDKVLKLFFVPVWNWPGKEPALYCDNCKFLFPQSLSMPSPRTDSVTPPPSAVSEALRCRFCDRVVEPDFSFCPFCGSTL
uniref:Uncharacterized protein LOC105638944 n=1 Tax=Rhizophora mucronata TaxID=61149 RepID=A0A2P2Q3M4_RHIMU